MKKSLAIITMTLFLGMGSASVYAGDVKAKAKAKTECQDTTKKCTKKAECPKKDGQSCPKAGEKKACCAAKK